MNNGTQQSSASQPHADGWRGWLALAWSLGFALLYARMVIIERFPALTRWLP